MPASTIIASAVPVVDVRTAVRAANAAAIGYARTVIVMVVRTMVGVGLAHRRKETEERKAHPYACGGHKLEEGPPLDSLDSM